MSIRLLLACVLVIGTGCYSYQATTLADVAPGTAVRVRVSPEEAERLAELRMSEERVVPGTLVRRANGGILLETPVVGQSPQRLGGALTQRIEIADGAIREVELRRLDRLRTGALIGALAAGAGYIIAVQLDGGRGRDEVPPDDNPERVRSPRFRFALPLRF